MRNKKLLLIISVFLLILFLIIGVLLGRKAPSSIPAPSPFPIFSPKVVGPDGTIMVDSTANHNFLYSPQDKSYTIIVYGSPFVEARKKAETSFLNRFGFTSTQACSLGVSIVTPDFINPNESQKTYRLSFCGSPSPSP